MLALLIPFLIICIGFKYRTLLNFPGYNNHPRQPKFSSQRVHTAFSSYATLSQQELDAKRTSYTTLSRSNKRLAQKIGYERKLDTAKEMINLNTRVAEGIAELMMEADILSNVDPVRKADFEDLSLVREAFKHFVRDWSVEGRLERARIFKPILDVLEAVPLDTRKDMKVLVPGCGLARLAWEVSELGFETIANDLSPYMLSCLRFLLSQKHTPRINHHVLHPYAHWFSHQRTNTSLFRPIHFPDVLPRTSPTFNVVQGDFLSLSPPLEGYDYIITLFFIDTSLDVISTLRKVHSLLRPGGMWINLGPLLWTGGAQAKIELSLEEVLLVAEDVGFRFLPQDQDQDLRTRTVECEYTADKEAMMKWIYSAEFWVARKI